MLLLTSGILIYLDYRFDYLEYILHIENLELYLASIFVMLSLNFKHLRGTTYRKSKTLVNYKIAVMSKLSTILIFYSSLVKMIYWITSEYRLDDLYSTSKYYQSNRMCNLLFLLYLPYYIDFAEYTGSRRIMMPSFFHSITYAVYRIMGTYRLINDNQKVMYSGIKDHGTNNTLEIPEKYILGVHPHGLFPFGSVGTLALPHDINYIENTTPLLNSQYLKSGIASFCFYIPIIREIYLWLGAVDCSKPILKNLLEQGNSVAVFIGGAQEAQYSGSGSTKLILKNRNGVFKLALETGASLVPVYTFGNNNIYNSCSWDLFGILDKFKVVTGLWFPRGYIVPCRHKFISVIGEAISVDKIDSLSGSQIMDEEVEKVKTKYIAGLNKLFDKYKHLDNTCRDKNLIFV